MRATCLVMVVLALGCGGSSGPPPPGEIIGRVEVTADVPAADCLVVLEGTPIGDRCDADGQFDLRRVPPGRWDLVIIADAGDETLPSRRIQAASNSGFITDVGAIRLALPGSVGGHVTPPAGVDLAQSIIAVPGLGPVTGPNPGGAYLLDQVAPGMREIALITPAGAFIKDATVDPARISIVDFDLGQLVPGMIVYRGVAGLVGDGQDGTPGITVQLISARNGFVVGQTTTASGGTFEISAPVGLYLIRASRQGNPVVSTTPWVVGHPDRPFEVPGMLIIFGIDDDLDGDGLVHGADPDKDGDGVDDTSDAFPYDPAESRDDDGDGVGNRYDFQNADDPFATPTPDTDGDTVLDFEDNCPDDPNLDQADGDMDGFGDVCDECGDMVCDMATENCGTCEEDCGPCDACGDEFCDMAAGEDCNTCEGDCGVCPPPPDGGMPDATPPPDTTIPDAPMIFDAPDASIPDAMVPLDTMTGDAACACIFDAPITPLDSF